MSRPTNMEVSMLERFEAVFCEVDDFCKALEASWATVSTRPSVSKCTPPPSISSPGRCGDDDISSAPAVAIGDGERGIIYSGCSTRAQDALAPPRGNGDIRIINNRLTSDNLFGIHSTGFVQSSSSECPAQSVGSYGSTNVSSSSALSKTAARFMRTHPTDGGLHSWHQRKMCCQLWWAWRYWRCRPAHSLVIIKTGMIIRDHTPGMTRAGIGDGSSITDNARSDR